MTIPRARTATTARRRSPPEWRTLICAQSRGNETRKQFCARHGVALSTFDWWRRRLHDKISARGSRALPAVRGSTTPLFVELAPDSKPASATAVHWDVELELGAGVILRLRRAPC